MDSRGFCSIFLVVGSVFALTSSQCDVTNCSVQCIPEHWRRQLCVFYAELQDWRATAVQCGLNVPEFEWDRSQSSTVQWETARTSWNTLQQMWRQAAIEDGLTVTLDELSGSGSGLMLVEPSEGVSGDLVTVWREELDDWATDLEVWQTHAQEPVSEGAESTSDPSDLWMGHIVNWSNYYSSYNTTYYETCPPVL